MNGGALVARRVARMMTSSSVLGNESLRSRSEGVEIVAMKDTPVSVGAESIIEIERQSMR